MKYELSGNRIIAVKSHPYGVTAHRELDVHETELVKLVMQMLDEKVIEALREVKGMMYAQNLQNSPVGLQVNNALKTALDFQGR